MRAESNTLAELMAGAASARLETQASRRQKQPVPRPGAERGRIGTIHSRLATVPAPYIIGSFDLNSLAV